MKKLILSLALLSISHSSLSSDRIEPIGDFLQIAIPAAGFVSTYYVDDATGREQFYKSFATTFALTHGLKYTIKRKRPDNSDNRSFPSGHTSAAFQGAAFIHKRYGLEYAIPAYLGASFVGYSRVHAKKHHISDVLAGAAIGTISSFYFTKSYKGITVQPVANDNYIGLNLQARW